MSPRGMFLIGTSMGFLYGFGMGRIWEVGSRIDKQRKEQLAAIEKLGDDAEELGIYDK